MKIDGFHEIQHFVQGLLDTILVLLFKVHALLGFFFSNEQNRPFPGKADIRHGCDSA